PVARVADGGRDLVAGGVLGSGREQPGEDRDRSLRGTWMPADARLALRARARRRPHRRGLGSGGLQSGRPAEPRGALRGAVSGAFRGRLATPDTGAIGGP